MGKTNQNETTNTAAAQATENTQPVNNGQESKRPYKPTTKQRFHDMEEAAKGAGKKAKSGIKKGVGCVGKGVREGAIDIASLGLSVIVGDAVNTAANNLFITGSAAANSAYNALTGKGTVNVKGRFGGWKTMSLADYTAAVNRGVKFKDAEANFFVNRHAKEFNTAGKIVGGVAGTTAGVGTFAVSRSTMKSAMMTNGEKIKAAEKMNRQAWAQVMEDTSSDDFFEDEEE